MVAVCALVILAGTNEATLALAERTRLLDLREESVDLAVTLAGYLGRIAPNGDPYAVRVGLAGWNRRHITETRASVFLAHQGRLAPMSRADTITPAPPTPMDSQAFASRSTTVRARPSPARGWDVAVPIGGGRPFGVLHVEVGAGRLEEWARLERQRAYAFGLLATLLLAGALWLVSSRWIGRPLSSLTAAMTAAHDPVSPPPAAPLVGPKEFQDLAAHYNELQEALTSRERERAARAGLRTLEERARGLDRLAQAEEVARGFAHEIGTPLNTMNGHLQLLREDLRSLRAPESAERVALLLEQLERVSQIVRGALHRGPWPEPRRRPTELAALASRLRRFLAPALEQAGVRLELALPGGEPLLVRTDPDLVEQVLLNLLRNAIEALPAGGVITLACGKVEGRAWLEVSDDGPGLPDEIRHHLFQPFATSKGAAGTGLGLSISRRLARTLGGDLTFVPRLRGTCWRLTLPVLELS